VEFRLAVMRRISLVPIAIFLLAAQGPSVHAQQIAAATQPDLPPEFITALDAACSNLAAEIQKHRFSSVAVFGAAWDLENFTELGSAIGDAVSSHLAAKASHFSVVDREQLRAKLESDRMQRLMVLRADSAQWLASDLKIPGVVLVTLNDLKGTSLTVHLTLFDSNLRHDTSLTDNKFDLPVSAPLFESLHRSLLTPELIAKRDEELNATTGPRLMPECDYCPRPDYTDAARRAKWQGSILLSALVTPEGNATEILVLDGAPYLIDRSMVSDLKTWRFRPALDASNHAVAQRIQVTSTFALF
jgi:TonB family protein